MYGWAPNGMGGLGDTCSDLAATWRSSMQNCTYDPDQNSACMQANTLFLADYLVAAQSAGCANPPMIGVIGPATDLGVAFAIDLVGHNVPDVQAILPNATPAQMIRKRTVGARRCKRLCRVPGSPSPQSSSI